jgi:hypothetical protein
MTNLETLRAILAAADEQFRSHVDPDLDAEAGMDGARGRYLQVARDLDNAPPVAEMKECRDTCNALTDACDDCPHKGVTDGNQ